MSLIWIHRSNISFLFSQFVKGFKSREDSKQKILFPPPEKNTTTKWSTPGKQKQYEHSKYEKQPTNPNKRQHVFKLQYTTTYRAKTYRLKESNTLT